ncbi:hypothetical protein [Chitinophaga sp. MM2321]|uniref:hypothetical protein n=1 Tax=Chitinophaga sp. MM2321 TaxID=3137178 RepID=UPI0032D57B18
MFAGIFSSSLQRKFCEGFLFYPFKQLRRYGNAIYKQYNNKSGIKILLDVQRDIFDFSSYYAGEVARTIQKMAHPQVEKVMKQLESLYVVSREDKHHGLIILPEFNERIIHFYGELNTFQSVVLANLEVEVRMALNRNMDERVTVYFNADHHHNVQKLLKGLIKESNKTVKYIQICMLDDSIYTDICVDGIMDKLIAAIKELTLTQEHLVGLLQHWKGQQLLNGRQIYYN